MALKEVTLPGGGRAQVRTKLSHERHYGRLALMASLAQLVPIGAEDPAAALMAGPFAETLSKVGEMKANVIRLCVHSWEGVRSPDGDELSFPADVGLMDEDDFAALYEAQEAAIAEGTAHPNASGDRSSPPSAAEDPIPNGPSNSTKPG